MNCPVCNIPLTMTERQGVEIDYCQRCRGVWLDRGELDKIIDRSGAGEARFEEREHFEFPEHHEKRGPYKQHDDYKYKKKKKESFLSELFDF